MLARTQPAHGSPGSLAVTTSPEWWLESTSITCIARARVHEDVRIDNADGIVHSQKRCGRGTRPTSPPMSWLASCVAPRAQDAAQCLPARQQPGGLTPRILASYSRPYMFTYNTATLPVRSAPCASRSWRNTKQASCHHHAAVQQHIASHAAVQQHIASVGANFLIRLIKIRQPPRCIKFGGAACISLAVHIMTTHTNAFIRGFYRPCEPHPLVHSGILTCKAHFRPSQVEWKLTRGKWRPRLLDFAREHSEATVKDASTVAFQRAVAGDTAAGFAALTKLKVHTHTPCRPQSGCLSPIRSNMFGSGGEQSSRCDCATCRPHARCVQSSST